MATSIEERLAQVEARLNEIEAALAARQPRLGLTIEEARAALQTPAQRSPEVVAHVHRLFGRFDGPEDLSEHLRDYLAPPRT